MGTLERPDRAWDELGAFLKAAQTPIRNPLLKSYWSIAAVRHGDHIAKIRVTPTVDSASQVARRDLDLSSGPDVFGPALAEELRARPFEFDLQVQLCVDLDTMPVNDVTVEWTERLSPFVTVARVRLPRQHVANPTDFDRIDALAFNRGE